MAPESGGVTIMASIIKRCDYPDWDGCPHPWIVRYCTQGGQGSRQREQSFADDLHEAENFVLKVEHDKRAHVFIDPKGDGSPSVLRPRPGSPATLAPTSRSPATSQCSAHWHVYPAIGARQIRTIRRDDIKEIIATMSRKGLSASRMGQAHLVINARTGR
jgi:hypothetical protein